MDKTNTDRYLSEIEKTEQRIEKREKEVAVLKERLKELKGLVLQSVLDKNNVSLPELIKTIFELYSDVEELPLQDEYTEEKENGRFKPTS